MTNNPESAGIIDCSEIKKFVDNQLWPAAKDLAGGDIRNYKTPIMSLERSITSPDVMLSETCLAFGVFKNNESCESDKVNFSFTKASLLTNIWTKAACRAINSPFTRIFLSDEFAGRREDGTDMLDVDLKKLFWSGKVPPLTAVIEYTCLDIDSYELTTTRKYDFIKLLDGEPVGSFNSNHIYPPQLQQHDDDLDSIVFDMNITHESYWDERDMRLAKYILDALGLYSPKRDQPAV